MYCFSVPSEGEASDVVCQSPDSSRLLAQIYKKAQRSLKCVLLLNKTYIFFSHIGLFLESFSRSFPYHVSWIRNFSTWQPMLCCFRQKLFGVRNLHFVLHVLWEFWPPCTSNGRAETLSGTCQRANTSVQGQIKPLKQKIFVSIEPKFSPLVRETRILFHYQEQTVSTIMQSGTLWS